MFGTFKTVLLRSMAGQQITDQIFFKSLEISSVAIYYHWVMKNGQVDTIHLFCYSSKSVQFYDNKCRKETTLT